MLIWARLSPVLRLLALGLVIVVATFTYFWLTGDDDDRDKPQQLAAPGTFTKVEDAERAAGYHIPIVRELNGWRLKSIEVAEPVFSQCLTPCDQSRMRYVALTYEPPAPGPGLSLVMYNPGTGDPPQPSANTRPIDINGQKGYLREQTPSASRSTMVELEWRMGGLDISAQAAFITDPSGPAYERGVLGKYSTDEFLAMMRSVR